jgi:hypothetical protein
MPIRCVGAVALCGPKSGPIADLFVSIRTILANRLGNAFQPYTVEQIHGTLIGLDGVPEPRDRSVLNRNYLEHFGLRDPWTSAGRFGRSRASLPSR